MSIQHRIRAIRDRSEARAEGVKRGPRPAEFDRASDLPSVDHERPAASTREHPSAPAPSVKPARPRRKAKSRRR